MMVVQLISLALTLSAVQSAPPHITSAYSKVDLDRCERLDDGAEPQSASWRCDGYAGVPLFVQSGDDRYDLDAGAPDSDDYFGEAFDYPGEAVEWRLRGGKPFAVIYRLVSAAEGKERLSRLIVETVGGSSVPCRVASIDGQGSGANELARAAADGILTGRSRCLGG